MASHARASSPLQPIRRRAHLLRYFGAAGWFIFTVSLTGWWVIFGLQQIDNLKALNHVDQARLVRQQTMLLWEGSALILLLTGGAAALGYFMVRERREAEQMQKFLATFTHELKTPLASLRLQAEALREDLGDAPAEVQRLLGRLVSDTARLTLQLDNSLFLADLLSGRRGVFGQGIVLRQDSAAQLLRMESVSVSALVSRLAAHWPQVTITCPKGLEVNADPRALESVLVNLFQNAITHGKASLVEVLAHQPKPGWVTITVSNTGQAFEGDASTLGQLFQRFYAGSGSGVGLHLVRTLVTEMGGDVEIRPTSSGFSVELTMQGSIDASGGALTEFTTRE